MLRFCLNVAGEWTIYMKLDPKQSSTVILNLRKLWLPTSLFRDEPHWQCWNSCSLISVTSYRIFSSYLTKITETSCAMILDTWKLQILESASFLKLPTESKKRGLCLVKAVLVSTQFLRAIHYFNEVWITDSVINRSLCGSRGFQKPRLWHQSGCFLICLDFTRGNGFFTTLFEYFLVEYFLIFLMSL